MKTKIILLLMIIFTISITAQRHPGLGKNRNKNRIDELEKVKLIEILNMDEESTLKFFARRNQFKKNTDKKIEERDNLLENFEQVILENEVDDESFYRKSVQDILKIEEDLVNGRKEFINSLDDILTEQQIAKLVVFEFKFRKNIRDMLFKHRRKSNRN